MLKKISDISSAEEIDLEWQRERLRDHRWKRHRSKIYAALTCMAAVGLVFWDETGSRLWKLLPPL